MNKTIIVLFLGILISPAFSHTPWGPCATIYTERNQGGDSGQVCGSGWLSNAFNNKISSISVPTGFNMRLFKEGNLEGPFIDIQEGIWNANPEWDDVISSVQYNNWGMGCSTMYSGSWYTGTSFLVCNNANLVPGFNDQVGSMWVAPAHFFRVFNDYDQKGDWIDIRGGFSFGPGWANNIKSMKLKHWSLCAWLFQGQNGGGYYFQMCDSGVLPSYSTKQASSISVPTGMILTVYKTADYTGESKVLTAGLTNLPDDWVRTIASAKVVITAAMD